VIDSSGTDLSLWLLTKAQTKVYAIQTQTEVYATHCWTLARACATILETNKDKLRVRIF